MATTETAAHQNLKHLAQRWARRHGYSAIATEVQLPQSAFRADVVAYKRAEHASGRDADIGETAVFECKQARVAHHSIRTGAVPIAQTQAWAASLVMESPSRTSPPWITRAYNPRNRSAQPSGELTRSRVAFPYRRSNLLQPVCGELVTSITA